MSFVLDIYESSVIVRVGKALDFSNASDFKQACLERVIEGTKYFVLDFSQTGILDSTGLGSIFFLYKQIVPLSGEVAFACISAPVRMVMEISRIQKVFPCFQSVEEACASQRSLHVGTALIP